MFINDHLKPSSHCCLSLLLVLVHHITVWWRCVNERSPLALLTLLPFPFIGTGTSHYSPSFTDATNHSKAALLVATSDLFCW